MRALGGIRLALVQRLQKKKRGHEEGKRRAVQGNDGGKSVLRGTGALDDTRNYRDKRCSVSKSTARRRGMAVATTLHA